MIDDTALTVTEAPDHLVVRFDRPDNDNAIDSVFLTELDRALDRTLAVPEHRMVVLTGTTETFCTGMDFASGSVGADPREAAMDGGRRYADLLYRLATMPRMVVSLVEGTVMGGGMGLVAASDLVCATPSSRYSLPEALWGLLPCTVLPYLMRKVGFQAAHAMTLTTLPITGERAHHIGLVDELDTEVAGCLRRLRIRARRIAPATVAAAKEYSNRLSPIGPEVRQAAVDRFVDLMVDGSVRDRFEAFARDRVPPWESR
ncbi:polyketide biosynthesis enoyl-CoA hydratase PksH [Stackebrandtia endophytica]|uniref:Polyketide biosynthesis enoyl-CoA hydratase PksH n=1 Tax=Stackebrandtia endophytica TaxID=1496996 RepID=A0A543ARV5_9ACTN|nr:enoyl-CoA hydratase-related protein [Stackebrandtia endophytica]TQL75320.1 polyketide biosynthesis enoyl-CoA hydratase PksH [Stackebrandtia endophytica]